MERFASIDPAERAVFFRECAARRGLASPVVVEKDFWVCWTLDRLFGLGDSPHLMFKGGTSLSKGYDLIERFSEDIDVAIERSILDVPNGFDPGSIGGTKARARALEGLDRATEAFVADVLLPQLRGEAEAVLTESYSLLLDPKDSQTILFSYPPALERDDYGDLAYINPVVRVELGSRSDHHPVEEVTVRPYTAEEFPERVRAFDLQGSHPGARPHLLGESDHPPRREQPAPEGRHTQGLDSRVTSPQRPDHDGPPGSDRDRVRQPRAPGRGRAAQGDLLRLQVGEVRGARPGTLRLVPDGQYCDYMRRDYVDMEPMFFGPRPRFEEVVEDLEALERRINEGG